MEKTQKISTKALLISILSVLLVASILMGATGAWFTSGAGDSDAGYTFGTITLGDIAAGFNYTLDEESLDVIMPGDQIAVDFDLINDGTADMWVRFQLTIGGTAGETYFQTGYADQLPGDYVLNGDGWVYKQTKMLGDLDGVANESENVAFTFTIPGSTPDAAEGLNITFNLAVQAVQVANNGASAETAQGWPESGAQQGALNFGTLTDDMMLAFQAGGFPGIDAAYFTEYGVDGMYGVSSNPLSQTSITIPSDNGGTPVTAIGEGAFWGEDPMEGPVPNNAMIEEVILPSSLQKIGAMAFVKLTNLTSIVIPENVTHIGFGAFTGTGLTEVTLLSNQVVNIYSAFGPAAPSTDTQYITIYVPNGMAAAYQAAYSGYDTGTSDLGAYAEVTFVELP